MGLIELFLQFYFILFLVRLSVADTGQMAFNRLFSSIIRLTGPVLRFLEKAVPRRLAPLLALALIVLLQGFLSGNSGPAGRSLNVGLERWIFAARTPFWGVARSLASYLIFLYKFYAFFLLIALFSPLLTSPDQLSRLARKVVIPRDKGKAGLLILAACFALVLALLRALYQAGGLIAPILPAAAIPGFAVLSSFSCLLPLVQVFIILIIVRAILSWFAAAPRMGLLSDWIEFLTDPFILPFRRMGLRLGMIDLSPLAAIFALVIARRLLTYIILQLYLFLPGAG
jgi:YggT family protein